MNRIFDEFCENASCHGIATGLNKEDLTTFGGGLWHPLTIRRMLQNEAYAGRTLYRKTKVEKTRDSNSAKKKRQISTNPQKQWIEVPDATPAIISQATFERTSGRLGLKNPRRIPNYLGQNTHRLRPFARCAYSPLKRPKSHYLYPQGMLFRVYIQVIMLYR